MRRVDGTLDTRLRQARKEEIEAAMSEFRDACQTYDSRVRKAGRLTSAAMIAFMCACLLFLWWV